LLTVGEPAGALVDLKTDMGSSGETKLSPMNQLLFEQLRQERNQDE